MWGLYVSRTFHLVEVLFPIFALVSSWRMLRKATKWGLRIEQGSPHGNEGREAFRAGSEETSAEVIVMMVTKCPLNDLLSLLRQTKVERHNSEKIDPVLKPESIKLPGNWI